MPAVSYGKPKKDSPTRHLFVANIPGAGEPQRETLSLLQNLGAVDIELPDDGRSRLYASYADVAAASQALAALTSEAVATQFSRRFVVRYAALKSEKVRSGELEAWRSGTQLTYRAYASSCRSQCTLRMSFPVQRPVEFVG